MRRDQHWLAVAAAASLAVGSACFVLVGHGLSPALLIAAALGVVVAAAALIEPFWALLLVLVVAYLRPGDRLPALQPYKIQLVLTFLTAGFLIIQQVLANRPPRVRHQANGWVLAFLAAALWCTLPAKGLGYTAGVLIGGLGSSMLLYYLVSNLTQSGPRLRTVSWLLGWVGALNVVLAVVDVRLGRNVYHGRLAGVGLLGDPNDLALSLTLIVPLMLALIESRRGASRWTAAGLLGVLLAGVLGTRSRGGLLATLVVLFGAGYRRVRSPRWRAIYVGLALVLALGVVHRVFVARGYGLTTMGRDISVQGRFGAWKGGLRMMLDHPLTGVGLEQFPQAFVKYRPAGFEFVTLTAHNSLVLVAGELAVPGLLTFVPMLLVFFTTALRVNQRAPSGTEPALRGALVLSLVGWLVAAMFLSQSYHIWLYIFAGLAVGAERGQEAGR